VFPVIQLGSIALQVPGLALIIGIWVGLILAERQSKALGLERDDVSNLVFVTLISMIIGARIGYVLINWQSFVPDPVNTLSVNPGLLDIRSGLLTGLIMGSIYIQRRRLPVWKTLDSLTPLLSVIGIALGVSHFASGAVYGMPAQIPWGIELWGTTRHPTQVDEIILAGIILGIILYLGRQPYSGPAGFLFFLFTALTASEWLILEGIRAETNLLIGRYRGLQIIAWFILAFSLWGMRWRARRNLSKSESLDGGTSDAI
jgi:phosphatidylglycerol:prolipoprotein diacylglycerol transferase